LLEILQYHKQRSIPLNPFLEFGKEVFLLRRRSRGRRGKGIHLLSGCQSCLAGPEIIKVLLCDNGPSSMGLLFTWQKLVKILRASTYSCGQEKAAFQCHHPVEKQGHLFLAG